MEVSTNGNFGEITGKPGISLDAGSAIQCVVSLTNAPSAAGPYHYRVVAYGDLVFGPYSAPVRVALDPLAAPSAQAASSVTLVGFTAN